MSASAAFARRGGPRAVPLHLNGVEIGVVKEPADRSVEEQALDQLCTFAVQMLEPGADATATTDLSTRQRCAGRLLRMLGVSDPRSATVLGNLKLRRDAAGALITATWRFEPMAVPA